MEALKKSDKNFGHWLNLGHAHPPPKKKIKLIRQLSFKLVYVYKEYICHFKGHSIPIKSFPSLPMPHDIYNAHLMPDNKLYPQGPASSQGAKHQHFNTYSQIQFMAPISRMLRVLVTYIDN